MMRQILVLQFIGMHVLALGCERSDGSDPDPGEELSGGSATVFDSGNGAFSHPVPGLPVDEERQFFKGRALFRDLWVTAPSSTTTRDGLGPVFNARSCEGCHIRDGRGRPPEADGEPLTTMLVRLSIPGSAANGAVVPEPTYGDQLQPLGIDGVAGEGGIAITYDGVPGAYGDGETYTLTRPRYEFTDLQYGMMQAEARLSPRVTPAMIGLGLLEAVPESALTALADPNDADGDGISGRINSVWSVKEKASVVGRFGWKANQPDLAQQAAGAFLGDIGMTSELFPAQNCTNAETACVAAPAGGDPEVQVEILDSVVFYSRSLAVPARRDWQDPLVRRGKTVFAEIGCDRCHVPKLETGDAKIGSLANQSIRPYTDLLLHDMGDGLADGRDDFLATGAEWRTPPLWGLGLLGVINGHTRLLHDGRARTVAEAILWHGGEGETAKERFRKLTQQERKALLQFLSSL